MRDLEGNSHLNEKLIEQFDFWLASRRDSVKNYLSPYSFSRFSDVNTELSMDLFYLSTTEEVKVLKVRYDVFLRSENINIASFYNYDDIPVSIENPETHEEISITENDILIYFELMSEPTKVPQEMNVNIPGKPPGVGVKDFEDTKKRCSYRMSEVLENTNNDRTIN